MRLQFAANNETAIKRAIAQGAIDRGIKSMLEENEHHVLDVPLKNTTGKQISLCGESIFGLWYFQDVGHAFLTRQQEGGLMICPDCLKVIMQVFEN